MRHTFPITKAERLPDGRLLVEGIATSEAEDSQGDILAFDGSVKALAKWMETGPNVREQHDPKKAVGRGLEMWPIPESKSVGVRVFVSKGAPDTQEKVLDQTLSMFSIGGDPIVTKPLKKHGKTLRLVEEWDCVELSLVDRGANPDARFEIVKGDQMSDQISGAAEETPKHAVESTESVESIKSTESVEIQKEEMAAEPEIGTCSKCNEKASMRLCDKCADAMGKAAAPELKKDETAALDIHAALEAVEMVRNLLSIEESEASFKDEDPAQVAALKAALKALGDFIVSEAKELNEPEPEPMEMAAKPAFKNISFEIALPPLIEAALAPHVAALNKQLSSLSAEFTTMPKPEPMEKALGPVQAQVGEIVKAVGDLKGLPAEIETLRKDVTLIKAQPVPGGPFIRKPTDTPNTNTTDTLRKAQADALREVAKSLAWDARLAVERQADFIEKG